MFTPKAVAICRETARHHDAADLAATAELLEEAAREQVRCAGNCPLDDRIDGPLPRHPIGVSRGRRLARPQHRSFIDVARRVIAAQRSALHHIRLIPHTCLFVERHGGVKSLADRVHGGEVALPFAAETNGMA